MHIGDLIRRQREKRQVSQACLAEWFGYGTGQFISNIERGVYSFPIEKARDLRMYLKIKKSDIQEAYRKDFEDKIRHI